MTIPDFAATIVSTIENAGFEAWLVGGCVRDALLGQEPGDYDIATNALPQQTAALFARSVPTGERYGTITVLLEGGKAEVTTFRLEGGYTDHRRPDDVTFTSGIEADLARRDFTVNAMAFSSARGLFDPFGGRSDLGARLIRAVGDPSARFREDALRILRAFRFSAQLGFAIEPCTLQAAADAAPLVGHVSRERVRDELQKLLVSTNPHVIFELLRAGVDCGVFHGLAGPGEGASRLDTAPCAPSARWAGFFALCGVSQAAAAELAATLKLDRLLTRRILALLEALAQPLPQGRAQIKRRLAGASPELLHDALALYAALNGADTSSQAAELEAILRSGEPYRISMLAVNGGDLAAAGIAPGPVYRRIFEYLLETVTERPELNERNTLLELTLRRPEEI